MKYARASLYAALPSFLSLILACHASAAPSIQQPLSVAQKATAMRDTEVTRASCDDDCCGEESCCSDGCKAGHCSTKVVCCPKKITEEVKKHCWNVKKEWICIPSFRFARNWGKDKNSQGDCKCGDSCSGDSCSNCGKPTCGRVRCIKVLEKHEYTCKTCGYEWELKYLREGSVGSRPKRCQCPQCNTNGCCAKTEKTKQTAKLAATNGPAKSATSTRQR